MKTLAVLFFLAVAHVVRAAPELVGVLTSDQGSVFAIMTEAGTPPRWVRLGGEVLDYRIADYRAKEEVLVLKRADATLELRLRDSKVGAQRREIDSAQAYARAIQEVQKREQWGANARFEQPQRGPKNWLIPVFHRLPSGRERCVLVGVSLTTGELAEYKHLDP